MATKTLAFEIGTEELPAFDLHAATEQPGRHRARGALDAAGVPHGDVDDVLHAPTPDHGRARTCPSRRRPPRSRSAGLPPRSRSTRTATPPRRPPASRAARAWTWTPWSGATRAASEYVYAVVRTASRDVAGLLPGLLADVVARRALAQDRSAGAAAASSSAARFAGFWHCSATRWSPWSSQGLVAGDLTWGHRFLAPGPHKVADADALVDVLRGAFVVPSEAERESVHPRAGGARRGGHGARGRAACEDPAGSGEPGRVPHGHGGLLRRAVPGACPRRSSVDAMLVHQRYFPLFNQDGTLANKFLITSNGDPAFRGEHRGRQRARGAPPACTTRSSSTTRT